MDKTKEVLRKLNNISMRPIENVELLTKYIKQSISDNREITFYNWECPPRFIDQDNDGKTFVNYCVDLSIIAKGKKIDRYTEIPRVISKAEEENEILKYMAITNMNFRFIKVIADTNALYITPDSVTALGKERILRAHQDFKKFIMERVSEYYIPVEVYLFTDLIKPFQSVYDTAYEKALATLEKNQLVSKSTYEAQMARTRSHIGLTDDQDTKEFTNRTIAAYAAEGIMFNELSKTDYFSNCVWLNIEEVNKRTIAITNSLRSKNGLGNLPMVFSQYVD